MPFEKGKPRPDGAGRRKGTLNTSTVVKDTCERMGVDPLEFLCTVVSDDDADLKERVKAATVLSEYLAPKLNRTEITAEVVPVDPAPTIDYNRLSYNELTQLKELLSKATPGRTIEAADAPQLEDDNPGNM